MPAPPADEPDLAQPFATLVAWACQQFAELVGDPAPVVALARAAGQVIAAPRQTCGLEFHHDGSGRVDFLVLVRSTETVFGPALGLPDWFHPLLARCTDTAREQAAPAAPGSATPGESGAVLAFPAQHWLEFDRAGAELQLAGIWQPVASQHPDTPRAAWTDPWVDQLAAFLAGTPVDLPRLRQSASLRHFIETLGMPTEVGVMSGRGRLVKMMVRPRTPAAYRPFFARPELAATIEQRLGLETGRFCRALARVDRSLSPRVILDLDLEADRFSHGFGLELVPVMAQRGLLPESLRGFCANVIGIDRATIDRAAAVLACLPVGRTRSYTLSGLEAFLPAALTREHSVAGLAHLKAVVRADAPPTLKTYVRLTLTRGSD